MDIPSSSIEKMVQMFNTLPSIGKKTAQRLTFHLLRQSEEYAGEFAASILALKSNVKLCSSCFNYTDNDPCVICASEKRNGRLLCVVENPSDLITIEKTNEFYGKYHVLHGLINPLENIGPEDVKIKELVARAGGAEEIILALSPGVEGEVTAQYIYKMLSPLGMRVTKIASGIPVGSTLEFTDHATLSMALQGRIELH